VAGITFLVLELADVAPHEDDPIVLSVVLAGRNVHRVFIDRGSSADIMF